MKPILLMLAGPNGAGKSTFYQAYLSHLDLPFLNADVLAAKAGLGAYDAAKQIASIRDHMIHKKESFITETVLSDPVGAKVDLLASAFASGYDVQLIFIGIADVDLSKKRVGDRTKAGGHDVPVEKILGRYPRTLKNLERAIVKLPLVTIYDNSSYNNPHQFIAEFREGKLHRRCDAEIPQWVKPFLEWTE